MGGAGPWGSAAAGPVLLYDGACGFCGATVALVLRRDRKGTLRFAPLGGAFARDVAARHPARAGADSVVWVEPAAAGAPERVLARSAAALRIASYLGGVWTLALGAWLVPRPLRDAVYDLVARHRHRLSGAACFVPTPEVRARFLDAP